MSGTSLDGISAAVVRFDRGRDGRIAYELLGMSVTGVRRRAARATSRALVGATPREYCRLAFDLGDWLADAAIAAIADAGVGRVDVAAIASHGQTVWHEPGHSTWQFGQPAVIAERTGIDVVSDFRVRDVAAAGQGAPLVPAADALLFAHATDWRALQNLGGIGNVTIVAAGRRTRRRRARSTPGPGVVVIDGVTRIVAPGLSYDVDGRAGAERHADRRGRAATCSRIRISRARRPSRPAASCSIRRSSPDSSSDVARRSLTPRPATSSPRPWRSRPRASPMRCAASCRSRCASSSYPAAARRIRRSSTRSASGAPVVHRPPLQRGVLRR